MRNTETRRRLLLTALALACLSAGCGDRGGENKPPADGHAGGPAAGNSGPQPGHTAEPLSGPASGDPTAVSSLPAEGAGGGAQGVDLGGRQQPVQNPSGHSAAGAWQVLSVSGNWYQSADAARTLTRGDLLEAGSALSLREPSQDAYITLIDPHNRIVRRECRRAAACRRWTPPTAHAADSLTSRIIRSGLEGLRHEEETLIDPMSRGGELKDGILLLADGQVNIRPALGRVPPGRYVFEFEAVGGTRSGGARGPFEVTLTSERSTPAVVKGLDRGLYRMRLVDETHERGDDAQGAALVLVSPPETYRKTHEFFSQSRALTDRWGERVEPDLVQRFLRAYLARLSREEGNVR